MNETLRVAVLLSGSGRTLENFLRWIEAGRLSADIVAVASDRPGVRGFDIAEEAGIPSRVFPRKEYEGRAARDAAMLGWLGEHRPDVLALAGYLSLLDLERGPGVPILNIHPALLPRHGGKGYYGDRVHAAVLESGERESGATVHLVNDRYDDGAIVARITVPVVEGDDVHVLADRVFAAECVLYPTVLGWLASGEIGVVDGRPVAEDAGRWTPPTLDAGSR